MTSLNDIDFMDRLEAALHSIVDAQNKNTNRLVAAIEKVRSAAPAGVRGKKPTGSVGKIPDGTKTITGPVEQVFGPNNYGWTTVKVNGFRLDTKLPVLLDAIAFFQETGDPAQWSYTERQKDNFTNRRLEAVCGLGEESATAQGKPDIVAVDEDDECPL